MFPKPVKLSHPGGVLVLSISIFRRLSLFPGEKVEKMSSKVIFQSPFSGDFLCFTTKLKESITKHSLSISIFRRLSLFLQVITVSFRLLLYLSISIFRRLSLFLIGWSRVNINKEDIFQSPFSGDFLCFDVDDVLLRRPRVLSISIFRRLSLFPLADGSKPETIAGLSISIFRRLSLFLWRKRFSSLPSTAAFQSPFSGDFLCFPSGQDISKLVESFQSPFSGDFLCF